MSDKKQLSNEPIQKTCPRYGMVTIQIFVLGSLLSVGHLLGQTSKETSPSSLSTSNAAATKRASVPAQAGSSKSTSGYGGRSSLFLDGPEGPSYNPRGPSYNPERPSYNPERPSYERTATPRIATGKLDSIGQAISVSCASCHANFQPDFEMRSGDSLKQFHQGLKFSHGKLTCLTCHNAKNYNGLRLAGEKSLDFAQAQTLCSQCHSKQSNDYERAAHGGMNGYWNAMRGVRIRKQCIDCHDPHAPAFPAMIPTFKPHDRFLESKHPSQSGLPHE